MSPLETTSSKDSDKYVELTKSIAQKIRALRKARNLTQGQIARKMDISYQQFQKYETGANQLTIVRLVQIADIFKCPLNALLPETLTNPELCKIGKIISLIAGRAELSPAIAALSRRCETDGAPH
jgi:transcriptional regulator with XRE-family HTH domain